MMPSNEPNRDFYRLYLLNSQYHDLLRYVHVLDLTYIRSVHFIASGIQADQRVLRTLICNYLPDVDETLKNHDIELSLITLHWFLTLFSSVVHMKILLRIWDLFFYEGSVVLFRITLGMLKVKESHLKLLENSAQIFNALSDIPGEIDDVKTLLQVRLTKLNLLYIHQYIAIRIFHKLAANSC